MKRSLLIAALLITQILFGQDFLTLKLQSGVYRLNPEATEKSFSPLPAEIINGHYYRILQFQELPTNSEVKHLKEAGVNLISYLPENAYLASLNKSVNWLDVLPEKLFAAAPLNGEMKLSKNLSSTNIPDYAIEGELVKIVALTYPNISEQDILLKLKNVGLNESFKVSKDRIEASVSLESISAIAELPFIYFVQTCEAPETPENHRARSSHRVNTVNSTIVGGYGLTGNGVVVGLGDDGDIGPHIDYSGRLTSFASPSNGNHGDHVSGTIFGAGNIDPNAAGMAPRAEMIYESYPNNLSNVDANYAQHAVRITNSSYSNGCNAGYTSYSQTMDFDIRQNYSLMHVFSSGNAGTSNCNYGAGSGWGNITGGHKQGKNVIATGNVTYLDNINTSSSRGPAIDGRIKPDVCAVGTNVYSCNAGNIYNSSTGTSMSAPGVAGTLALMYEYYNTKKSQDPPGGLMKAILMNTAEDLGNTGPDYIYGYGRINVLSAIETMESEYMLIDTISQGENDSVEIQVPTGVKELRVMLYWTDKEGNPNANIALVNNLDLLVTDVTTQTQYLPWVLDPTPNATNLNSLALRAVDSLNNAEQVTILNPSAGNYKINVSGSTVPFGNQEYYIVYHFVEDEIRLTHPFGGEMWDPTETQTIRWDAIPGPGTFDLHYSIDSGKTWLFLVSGVAANQNYYDWDPNDTIASSNVFIKIFRGNTSSINANRFNIFQSPKNLNIDWVCGDSLRLSWTNRPEATMTQVHQLGTKYMDVIDTSYTNSIIVHGLSVNSEYWLSVSALGTNGLKSKRAIAVNKAPFVQNCPLTTDVGIYKILSPQATLADCQNNSALTVSAQVKNNGLNPVYSIPIHYKLNNGTVVTDTIKDTIYSFDTFNFAFSQTFSLTGIGSNTLKVYTSLNGDLDAVNDTITNTIVINASGTISLPSTENFNAMSSCPTTNNCGLTLCSLSNNWLNASNTTTDDIDWRVNSGGTPSSGTGPISDVTGSGKYLYLEASNGCTGQTALLISPCINLIAASIPELVFSYNMIGTSMGSLHVDVIVDGVTEYDVIPPIEGNQGFGWFNKTVYLQKYVGKTINVQFRGITGSSWSSDLAIDEIVFQESTMTTPSSLFSVDTQHVCSNDVILFTSNSTGAIVNYKWEFGSGASPSSANTKGPHLVYYNHPGTYNPELLVSNYAGKDSSSQSVVVDSSTLSQYNYNTLSALNYQFLDNSKHKPTSWLWLFGDGNQSTLQNPIHSYNSSGNYSVSLITANNCGGDTLTTNFYASGIGIEESQYSSGIKVYPNPTNGWLYLKNELEKNETFKVRILNSQGQELYSTVWNSEKELKLNTQGWSSGIYLIYLESSETHILKFSKQ